MWINPWISFLRQKLTYCFNSDRVIVVGGCASDRKGNMTPDFDTYLMDAYDRWCETMYDTEDEVEYEHDVYDDEPLCEHCQAQGTEEHNGGCPNSDSLFVVIAEYTV